MSSNLLGYTYITETTHLRACSMDNCLSRSVDSNITPDIRFFMTTADESTTLEGRQYKCRQSLLTQITHVRTVIK